MGSKKGGVSIHVPARGATVLYLCEVEDYLFQSTFPHGERPQLSYRIFALRSFNPRSRTGNDCILLEQILNSDVSIHVPARGTTLDITDNTSSSGFQSTFPHGERPSLGTILLQHCKFQSTFPHGERPMMLCILSILTRFNPRSRTGNDDYIFRECIICDRFQSTFPHGERRYAWVETAQSNICFNPRSRTGNDLHGMETANTFSLFQSTFPHGERP